MMETVGELSEIRIFQMNEGYFLDKPILGDSKKKTPSIYQQLVKSDRNSKNGVSQLPQSNYMASSQGARSFMEGMMLQRERETASHPCIPAQV